MINIKARKLELKKQFLQVRGIERQAAIDRAILVKIRQRKESEIGKTFNKQLSQEIDALNFLIDSRGPNEKDFDGSPQIC